MARVDLTLEQQELADFMSLLSQRTYRAVWMSGIESELWKTMHGHASGSLRLTPSAEEIQRLRTLSGLCGGWIVFDAEQGETFVPLTEWMDRVEGGGSRG